MNMEFKKKKLPLLIAGAGGGGSSGGSTTPKEARDTVNSRAMSSILDLLGEGVLGGLVDGAKSIYLDGTPLQNSDGSYNHTGVTWWFRDGSPDQSVIDGFDFVETPRAINLQVKTVSPVTFSVDNDEADRVRVIMKFPSLRTVNKKSGDTSGISVKFRFQISNGDNSFKDIIAEGEPDSLITLTEKKTSNYYRSYTLKLPKPGAKYKVRVVRVTEDHTNDAYLFDDTYVDSIGEIVDTALNYPNSALVGLKVNSEQFGSTIPTRSYLIKGMKIRVPSNYLESDNEYVGTWDGTFRMMPSENPAWILFDLLTNERYGLGEFVRESMIDLSQIYQVGRYCDEKVDNGFGGKEKRFAINTQITSRQDAYRTIQDIAGAFRGMIFWAGGMIQMFQDSPSDPTMLFSNSNVKDGKFVYKGTSRKDRPSVALVTYNNKEDGYKQNVEYVEDQEAIKRYGIRKTESVAFGCTSRGQAHRVGLWILYTARMESDVISFTAGMDASFLMPGETILIQNKYRAGRRNSGRIVAFTKTSITLDAPVNMAKSGYINFSNKEGKIVERDILESGTVSKITFKTPLSSAEEPVPDAMWMIGQTDLVPMQARVVKVGQAEDGVSYEISAIQNNPSKYEAIDNGATLLKQNTTILDPTFSTPERLQITEGTYLSSPGNLSVMLTASWEGRSPEYSVSWRRSDAAGLSGWKSQRVTDEQFELKNVAENGQYDFQVFGVSVGGRKTEVISATYKVLGTLTAPDAPTGLTAVGDYRSIVLNWVNPASVDLDHIEVLASKINDKAKAQLIAKVSGTTFSHNGLEDSVTWYYWVRAVNKRGMLSALNSPLATTATTRDVLSFLKNKITESELGKDLLSDIDSKAIAKEVDAAIDEAKSEAKAQVDDARTEAANAVKSAKDALSTAIDKETLDRAQAIADEAAQRSQTIANETTARNKAIADEASIRATAISNEVTTRTNAIAAEVDARTKAVADEATMRNKAIAEEADARKKAVTDEATARAKAVSDEAIARASAITDSVAIEASNRAKAVSDATAALDTKISKEASDRASAVSALDTKTANAINTETSNRISSIESEARARADALLQEKNNRQSEISNLSTQVQTANESLAQQISQIAAGTGEQFDSLNIWYFDTNSEGWTEDDGSTVPMAVTDDGWLKSSNSAASCRSPNNMVIDANAYRFLKLRIKKVGKPTWSGKLYWIGASEQGWSESRSLVIDEPEYDANGVATLTIHDIDWRASTTIRRFRFDFLKNQSDTNNLLIDWIAVGRPTPGAGMAALQDEKSARVDADAAEAANRNALAVQMRGSYEGNDLSKVGSGLIFQEQLARVTADKAEATARQSLETKVNDSVSNINKSLDTLNTQDKAMASDITGLKSSLKGKADASALQTLKTSVEQQGSNISTQSQSITKLQNDLNTTDANVGKKADQSAMTALQGTVTQQGKDISSANSNITNLKTSLDTTNNNVAKKADANAVSDLASRVSSTEGKVSSQADSIIQLNNSLSNAVADTDIAKKMPTNLIVNSSFERGTEGYTGISSSSTVVSLQSPRTGSLALKIAPGSVAPGQNVDFVKDRTYEIGVWVKQIAGTTDGGNGNNKLRVGNSAGSPVFELPFTGVTSDWTKFSKRWKATETGSLPVTLNNYLTAGNRYFDDFYVIDVTDSVNIDANASALSSLQNTVTQQGKDISSQSTSITDLKNSLKSTNDNVSKKADASAVQTLQNTVTQQGKDLTTAGTNITSLQNGLATTNANVSKKADATALNALQNTVTQQGSSITSQGNSITQLQNGLTATNANVSKKADASALTSLQNTVTQQGKDLSSASSNISTLKNSLATTDADLAKKADSSALSSLQNTVTQQGKDLSSVGNRTTNLENNLKTTDANVSKKADASAVDSLQNTVTQQGKDITSASDALTSLNNSVGAMTNMGDNLIQDANLEGDGSAFRTQQNSGTTGSIVAFGAYGENSAGARMLKVNATSPGLFANGKKPTPINGARKFRYVVRAKGVSGAMNMLLRRWNYAGSREGSYLDKNVTLTTDWQTIIWDSSFALSADTDGQAFGIYCHPNNAEIWIDSFTVFDITDATNNDATASALSDLSTKVTKQGDTVSSQGTAITNLQNDLTSAKADVAKKADATALQTLQNTVTQQGKDLTSQSNSLTTLNNSVNTVKGDVAKKADTTALNGLATRVTDTEKGITSNSDAITSLNNSLSQQSRRGANILPDGTFESYSNGYNLSNGRVIVTTDDAQSGSKCIRVTRSNNYSSTSTDNNDSHIFSGFSVRDNAVFYIECWVKLDAAKADMAPGTQLSVGMSIQYQDNSWQWPAVTKAVKDLSATEWTKVYGYLKLSKSGVKQSMVRISIPNVSTVKAGDAFLIDNIVITEVTDAYNSQTLSDANASALQTLGTTVDKQGSDITSQGTAITKLQNDLGTTNANVSKKADATALQTLQNTVTDQGKTLTSQGSAITTLNNTVNSVKSDVAKKADAAALQTLNNTVTQQGKDITSTSNGVTSLTNSLATTDASVAKKADSSALTALQSTVTQQGKDITSANSNITTLKNSLASTDANVAKKADASALSSLQNTVTQQGKDIVSTTNNLDSLTNQLTNGKANTWSRRMYKLQLASSTTEPTFSDIQGLSPYLVDEVADVAKLDFASVGSYVIAHYKSFVRVDADTKITMAPGSRVFDDTGAVYVNDSRVAAGGANTGSIGIILKAGWNTIEFLVNQWTGNAYINLNLKISEKVQEMYSAMGVTALSNAISEVNSNVSKIGDTVTSNSSDITKLTNNLASTDANVAKKADSSALSSLQNTVTQQGKTLSSQGDSIISLQNSLNTTDGKVAKKAEQSAVDSLTGRVTKTENDITAANSSVTSLNAAIRAGNASSGDFIPNPTFDPAYNQMGFNVVSTDSAGVPAGCPFKYAAKISSRDHHPNFNTIVATAGDVFEISVLVACGVGAADFNLYIGSASGPTGGLGAPLYAGGNTKTTSSWKRVTWRVTVPQSAADKGYLRPFLQINQSSPFGTVWYVTDWHMRNITAAANAQNTADTTAKAVDSLTSTVNQQGKDITSVSSRATTLENGLSTANGNIGKKADASALSSLQNTVTQQGKDLTSQGVSITSLQNSLNTTNSNVSKKADSSALSSLQNTVNQQGNAIGSQGSQITMLSNSITEGSLIGNGGLSVDASMWTDSGNGSGYTYDAAEKAIRSTTGSIRVANITRIPVEAGTALTLMFDFKMSENVTAYSSDTVGFITSLDDPTNWLVSQSPWLNGVTAAWQTKTITLTIPDNFTGSYVYLRFAVGSWTPATSARLYLRKVDVTASNGVAKKADASAVNTLSSRVDSVQGSVTSQGSQITNLQNSLNATNTNVAKKADAAALQTLQNTVNQQGKDLTTQSNSLTSLSNSLNSVSVGGTNLIPRSGTMDGWANKQSDTFKGNSIAGKTVNAGAGYIDIREEIIAAPLDASEYVYSFYAKGAINGQALSVFFYNPNTTSKSVNSQGTETGNTDGRSSFSLTTEWKRYWVKWTQTPGTGTKRLILGRIEASSTASQTVFIGSPKLEAGNLPTEWSPAPSDLANDSDVKDLSSKVTANSSAIQSVTSRVANAEGNISSQGSAITTLQNGLNTTNGNVSKKADASALQTLQNTVKAQGDSISSVGNRTTSLENGLSTTNVNVAKKADTTALQTLQSTVTQQGKDIASASNSITSLQNNLNTTNTNVSKKADATALSALQSTVTQQGKDISSQGSSLTQLTNDLNSTNASIDAAGQIPGNMITNASFERANGGYNSWGGPVSVMTAQSPHSGTQILKIGVGGPAAVGQKITYVKDRTYQIGVWARQESGTTISDENNTKFRIADGNGLIASYAYGPFTTVWKEISFKWKATKDVVADTQITAYLSAGFMYFDDFYVIDITDRVALDATSSALTTLTSRVTSTEGAVSNHSGSLTSLNNTLSSLNKTVSAKADASALQSLQNTVIQQGKDLSSASGSVTDLQSSLNTLKVQSNPWIDGTFETYSDGAAIGGNTAVVTTAAKFSGGKCLKITRPSGTSGNSDKTIGSYSVVRQGAKYRVEFMAMMTAGENPSSGWVATVGIHSVNKDGGNDWQGVAFNESMLGARDVWVKFSDVITLGSTVTRSHVWMSTRGVNGSGTPGYSIYIDDLVITDVTDAAEAQKMANANATAISSLQTKTSDLDGKITAQTSQLTSMQSKVDGASSKVDQLSKTISDSQSTQASLNTSLQSQIDSQASANIKNQAELNSAATSIASIKSIQSTQATQLSAVAKSQTDMTASLNNQSASIQTLQEAVSNNDALNSTWMVKMETNSAGKKYAAGIALGVDGKNQQSQFLVQADRFALINTSNGNTTTPFVIDNGVTYMSAAYIKDGSISSAKVGDLMSNGFQENVRGWRISRDGTMNINGSGAGGARTTITNGKIEVYDSNNRLRVRMGIF